MISSKSLVKIGLIGFGTVGSGVVDVLKRRQEFFRNKLGAQLELTRIADKDITSKRPVRVSRKILTTDAADIYDDPDIDVVIELVGGIEPARTFILKAIENGKHIVTANKALLALHGKELFEAALKKNVSISYEASCAGGIPLIIGLRDGLIANDITLIQGILNGTANYILTQMTENGKSYDSALQEAQELGYAEADPTFDVEGMDTGHKLTILAGIAFGAYVNFKNVYIEGITALTPEDISTARDLGCVIKMLAVAKFHEDRSLELRIQPAFIPGSHPLASINGVENAVQIRGDVVGDVMFRGPGAGRLPTASAVVADVVDVVLGRARLSFHRLSLASEKVRHVKIRDIQTRYCVRMKVRDKPGVLSRLTAILSDSGVSIRSVIQKEADAQGNAAIIILTHKTEENCIHKSMRSIKRLSVVTGKPVLFRYEELE